MAVLAPLLPKPRGRTDRRGRPWRDPRDVLNGILWILKTGAPWHDLPHRYPPDQTCHRRYQAWVRAGVLDQLLFALAEDVRTRGVLDLSECFIDGSFVIAKGSRGPWPGAGWRLSRCERQLRAFRRPAMDLGSCEKTRTGR